MARARLSIAEQYDAYQQLYEEWGSEDGYLNWGYATRPGEPLAESAEALVRLVFDAVELAPEDLVVATGRRLVETAEAHRDAAEKLKRFRELPAQGRSRAAS